MKIGSSKSILGIYKSTNRSFLKYCCHIWYDGLDIHVEIIANIQKMVCNIIDPD